MPLYDRSDANSVRTADDIIWNIVQFARLEGARHNHQLIYVGSIAEFHLVYNQSKMDGPAWYALPKPQFTPSKEYAYQGMRFAMQHGEFLFRQ